MTSLRNNDLIQSNFDADENMLRSNLYTFGGDFKITPRGEVGFIELNGADAGFEGLVRLRGKSFENERKKALETFLLERRKELLAVIKDQKVLNFSLVREENSAAQKMADVFLEERVDSRLQIQENCAQTLLDILNDTAEKNLQFARQYAPLKRENIPNSVVKTGRLSSKALHLLMALFGVEDFVLHGRLGLILKFNQDRERNVTNPLWEEIYRSWVTELPRAKGEKIIVEHADKKNHRFLPCHDVRSVQEIAMAANNNEEIEKVTNDKWSQKKFVPAANLSPAMLWQGNTVELFNFLERLRAGNQLLDYQKYPLAVLKKISGKQGTQVKILDLKNPLEIVSEMKRLEPGQYLLEGFVAGLGKGVLKTQDATMRYYAHYRATDQMTKNGVEELFAASYWRVSPKSFDDQTVALNDRFRVNLAQGAIAEQTTLQEHEKVRSVMRGIVERLIANQAAIGNPLVRSAI